MKDRSKIYLKKRTAGVICRTPNAECRMPNALFAYGYFTYICLWQANSAFGVRRSVFCKILLPKSEQHFFRKMVNQFWGILNWLPVISSPRSFATNELATKRSHLATNRSFLATNNLIRQWIKERGIIYICDSKKKLRRQCIVHFNDAKDYCTIITRK